MNALKIEWNDENFDIAEKIETEFDGETIPFIHWMTAFVWNFVTDSRGL